MKLLPIQHALVLHRVDPDRHVARFDSQMIKRDLFGTGGFGSAEAVLGGTARSECRDGRWLSGIGALLAVVVSLHLAKDQ